MTSQNHLEIVLPPPIHPLLCPPVFHRLVYDASGYYAGSIYAGNNVRRGNPQLCRDLNRSQKSQLHAHANTNMSTIDEIEDFLVLAQYLPFNVHLVNAKYKMLVANAPFDAYVIHQTVCMPKSCTHTDLRQVMSFANMPHIRNNLIARNTELIEVNVLQEAYEFYADSVFLMFLWVFWVGKWHR